ncbi:MAG: hypothetical protein HY744_25840 [Deltaproteobacteria bacterium]|nr:hypothetical protein [Deltaproteobacteria bacterium]
MSKTPTPLHLGTTVLLVAVLGGIGLAAVVFGDDVTELWASDSPEIREPVRLQGYWLGMELAGAAGAGPAGRPAPARGVRVVEISESYGWRARQAGLMAGDTLVSVAGRKVDALGDLDALARDLDVGGPLRLEVLRWGQPLAIVLPPLPPLPLPAAAVPPPAAVAGPGAALVPASGVGPPLGVSPDAQLYYCPSHRLAWARAQVHPHYRCPQCYGPLSPMP